LAENFEVHLSIDIFMTQALNLINFFCGRQ
jgi:hypothetical protein